ncbi:succinate--hydroxymethylglutarate CoA-transferase-like isoform X3 [Uloborus diversus]|uniref:succinate--hydroxymethylglutarate CoA-transferase-like isoform X3 n=1 Tax=Uloborus diversus TaxID=327109 RepID=UPI002409957A|nr:succinate--hydroxymethylglutarate CoA-transferase-like isoform X3 [Uloborus diversus]
MILSSTLARKRLKNAILTGKGPLSGIRILDLTRILAGPFCTMVLGDLGAEVIKVENPGGGDETRNWGPPFLKGESAYFLCVNRNKKSIAINMKEHGGRELIKDLALKSDVLVENFIPGKLDKFGLGYEELKSSAPHLIYCSITGYGSSGPCSSEAGFDVIAASVGGLLGITGPENGEPCKVGVAVTDLSTGLYAHGAIMAALIQRMKTGLGQKIDCDLLSTQLLNVENLAEDVMFLTNKDRVKNRQVLEAELSSIFCSETTDHWLSVFKESGMPYGPVNTMEEVFKHPQVLHNKMVAEMVHSHIGKIRVTGPAVKYSTGSNEARSPPPTLGEHTNEVLSSILQYSNEKINRLRALKVVS